jgi:hypothetical protein
VDTSILDPAAIRPTNLVAERILQVCAQVVHRVQLVTVLPYIMKNIGRFRVSLGSEIVDLLKTHAVIISSYKDIHQELELHLKQLATQSMSKGGEESSGSAEGKPNLSFSGMHVY